MKPIILIGGGGHCISVIEAAESCGREIAGILDLAELVGGEVACYRIVGTDSDITRYADTCEFIVTLGSIKSAEKRKQLFYAILKAGATPATLIASTAYVSKRAVVKPGSVVLHHATVNAGAVVGSNCIINTAADIEHNTVIGDHSHISTGAMVNGDVIIGENSFAGSGSVIANNVKIAACTVIGAGAVVISDISAPGIYAGVPAKRIS